MLTKNEERVARRLTGVLFFGGAMGVVVCFIAVALSDQIGSKLDALALLGCSLALLMLSLAGINRLNLDFTEQRLEAKLADRSDETPPEEDS